MPKITVKITLLRSDQGGRVQPLPAGRFGCPVFFNDVPELSDHAYDCRFSISEQGRHVAPGETVENIEARFLSPDIVLPHMRPGIRFTLWEGKPIGQGLVVAVE